MRTYIEIGKIVRPHGFRGAVKAEAWCDSPDVLAGMSRLFLAPARSGEPYREIRVLSGSVQKQHVLLTLEGIESEQTAAALKNALLYAHRDDIPVPEGSHLIADLIGLPVTDLHDGHRYGTLRDVIRGAGGELYEIQTDKGPVLMPAVPEFIKEIDLSAGIVIDPIEGFFHED